MTSESATSRPAFGTDAWTNHRQPESTPTYSGKMASELGNSDATIRASDTAHGCQGSVVDHLPRIQMWAGAAAAGAEVEEQLRHVTSAGAPLKAGGARRMASRVPPPGRRRPAPMSSARTSSRPAAVVGNGFVALGTIVPAFRSHGVNPQQDTSGTRFAVRSEERRVGKECRCQWARSHTKKEIRE